jgi:hypothetical protein
VGPTPACVAVKTLRSPARRVGPPVLRPDATPIETANVTPGAFVSRHYLASPDERSIGLFGSDKQIFPMFWPS